MVFRLLRPKGHYRGEIVRELRVSAPVYHIIRPDALKLGRAVEDALSGIVYQDDAQIIDEHIRKIYGPPVGVTIRVWAMSSDRDG